MNIGNSRIEYISSANRTSGTNESFTYSLTMSPNEVYDKVCVLFANIPISYYLVRRTLNTFQLTEGATTVTITIPIGNYSSASFSSVVVPLLNSASLNAWSYSMSLNNGFTAVANGLYTFSVTGNTSQPSFTFLGFMYDQFGFNANSTNTFSAGTLTSTNVVNFVPETTLFIYSDIVETKDNNTTNILQEFYGENNVSFSNLVYQCTSIDGYSKNMCQAKSNSFTIILTDEQGRGINLNGRPFFISLLFYKSNDFYSIIIRFLKYFMLKN